MVHKNKKTLQYPGQIFPCRGWGYGDEIVDTHEYIYVKERCEQLTIVTQDVLHAQV